MHYLEVKSSTSYSTCTHRLFFHNKINLNMFLRDQLANDISFYKQREIDVDEFKDLSNEELLELAIDYKTKFTRINLYRNKEIEYNLMAKLAPYLITEYYILKIHFTD